MNKDAERNHRLKLFLSFKEASRNSLLCFSLIDVFHAVYVSFIFVLIVLQTSFWSSFCILYMLTRLGGQISMKTKGTSG